MSRPSRKTHIGTHILTYLLDGLCAESPLSQNVRLTDSEYPGGKQGDSRGGVLYDSVEYGGRRELRAWRWSWFEDKQRKVLEPVSSDKSITFMMTSLIHPNINARPPSAPCGGLRLRPGDSSVHLSHYRFVAL